MARLLSVNVGLPRDIPWQGQTVHTGIWKTPVNGPLMVRRLNIDGDGQGDLQGHGGERRAVFVYQIESYRYWQTYLRRTDFVYGQFGENFTVDGLADTDVCIGDRYRIGGALFEVTQPRVTCYRLGIRMAEPDMAALVVKHGKPGFYFRVIEEGQVEAGDDITRVGSGPEQMSVSEIDALLYKPGHPRAQLERALRIPARSVGWRRSFEALLTEARMQSGTTGNAGLGAASGPAPAWCGFRLFRIARKVRESVNVISLWLAPTDGHPVAAALPGQFVVLRLEPPSQPALMRSYSLSGGDGTSSYRVSIKQEADGAASRYIHERLGVGDIVGASAARGNFILRQANTPVVLLSAGIGVTPVLAMLQALAADVSPREVWWLYGARNGHEHPFAAEARGFLESLPHAHSHVCYSVPDPGDRPGIDFDATGRLNVQGIEKYNVPLNADFYICGPSSFMSDLNAGLTTLGVTSDRIHTEMFGAIPSVTPGIAALPRRPPHLPARSSGSGPMVSFARSGLNVRWGPSFKNLLELAEACDVPVRWSCRTGVCHTCETGIVAGKVGYHPDPIDAPAEGIVLICCTQPEQDIVLDL
ncbi:MOSC and FAD-binding oxidoreductase domain-containing protein [Bradyrhizobium sp. CB2312]|uniref:MOSC and FAD-binding oxidoreductase domain-containing protein n=1 Tax=Bradyrhizobium sp. CB2312 TaxID=3039155 RepID=UPI0024B1B96F|nr:MOSC and FAD-binding oxidoreductase domain-containing protein [Bradyrhizobium sp. CB2312]WFU73401.1 MOSC and FAD-binding oxidoreductase domain-containing protein [Bradyrhizobium sp. CB2312]